LESRAILQWGAGFAREYGAELAVLHAVSKGFDLEPNFSVKQEARDRISFLEEELAIHGEILVEAGDAAEAVRAAAESTAADLVVIGRGRAVGHHGRLRTHSYAILRESPCPVVAI
jgi:nucleotide-binding universal stress UspA family protein